MVAALIAVAAFLWQRFSTIQTDQKKATEEETAIFFWAAPTELRDEKSDKHVGWYWQVIIQNSTQAPVYTWIIEFDGKDDILSGENKRLILPNINEFNVPFLDNMNPLSPPFPTMYFKGKSGKYWRKSVHGECAEIDATTYNRRFHKA